MREPFRRNKARRATGMVLFFLVSAISTAVPYEASASPMTFSVNGTGAVASGFPAISTSPFWWIDSTGGVSGAAVDPFGFDLFQGPGVNGIPKRRDRLIAHVVSVQLERWRNAEHRPDSVDAVQR